MRTESIPHLVTHSLVLPVYGDVKSIVLEIGSQSSAAAIVFGDPSSVPNPLVRIHSRCTYGELFGSLDCDCRAQLELAIHTIGQEGLGVFIYLEHEGRGCGLLSKARAYRLKEEEGLDTVEAYERLDLPVDIRSYDPAARILKSLGLGHIRLLTNNPEKIASLTHSGIIVDQIHLRTQPTPHNIDYLRVKQIKLGHDLGLEP